MNAEILLSVISILLLIITIYLLLTKKVDFNFDIQESYRQIQNNLEGSQKLMKDEFQRNRTEAAQLAKSNREELTASFQIVKSAFDKNLTVLHQLFREKMGDFEKNQLLLNQLSEERMQAIRSTVEKQLETIRQDNNKQLEEVRKTVDEKLQKTLNERLTQSFESVGKQLMAVQSGLGEMKTLATDVGGLKKVLSNVKMRGGIGEIQLEMLLEQVLAPDQFEKNVKTKKSTNAVVEFAIKLPGKNHSNSPVWLPIDAKFPKDIYEKLQTANEEGNIDAIATVQKELISTIKKMAKDIHTKYIDPPNTTNFALLFLPFEGIYAEVVRSASLLEELQRDYKIIITGPTTLAAILNSLQMGFKTLAIEKRSSEVWQILGSVKKEFQNFGGLMQKAQNNIQTGLNQLDQVMGVRTRAIQKKLSHVASLEIDPDDDNHLLV